MRWKAAAAVAVLVSAGLAACRDATTPDVPAVPTTATVVPGQYIVVFRDGVTDPVGLSTRMAKAQGGTVHFTYTSALQGFAARLSDDAVRALEQDPLVAYVEPDREFRIDVTQSMNANGDP